MPNYIVKGRGVEVVMITTVKGPRRVEHYTEFRTEGKRDSQVEATALASELKRANLNRDYVVFHGGKRIAGKRNAAHENDDPYAEGFEAAAAGKDITVSPYIAGTHKAMLWQNGYRSQIEDRASA